MSNQSQKPKSSFDILEHMRKPHGIFVLFLIIGAAGWAIWTFFFSARIIN